MPTQTPSIPLAPPLHIADVLIADLLDPALSFHDIARRHAVPLEAIFLWMTAPDLRQRLASSDDACCARTRFIANAHLPKAAAALGDILDECAESKPHASPPTPPANIQPDLPHPQPASTDPVLNLRRCEVLRKACAAIFRLSRHRPFAAPPAPKPTPTPPRMQDRPNTGLQPTPSVTRSIEDPSRLVPRAIPSAQLAAPAAQPPVPPARLSVVPITPIAVSSPPAQPPPRSRRPEPKRRGPADLLATVGANLPRINSAWP